MEETETTENEHAVSKAVASVTKDKRRNNYRKCPSFKREPKAVIDLEAMKEIVVNMKKWRENFKPPDAKGLYCQSLAASLREISPRSSYDKTRNQ